MTANKPMSIKLSIAPDSPEAEWLAQQANRSQSVRLLIQWAISQYGAVDLVQTLTQQAIAQKVTPDVNTRTTTTTPQSTPTKETTLSAGSSDTKQVPNDPPAEQPKNASNKHNKQPDYNDLFKN